MNYKNDLSGVFAPITTPFTKEGEVDYDGLKYNMERYAKSRIQGYLALGSNGENKSLSYEEKLKVLELIIKGKDPSQKVMTGCIAESTKETIQMAKEAESMGSDFLTLLSPSYFKSQMTDAALQKYFYDVADAVSTPCLVYCAPQFTGGITFSGQLVKTLAQHGNIVGMKDSSSGNIDSYLMAAPDDFAVMAGSANFFISSMTNGAVGGVISLANAFPDLTVDLYDLWIGKQYEACFEMNWKVLRINKAVSGKGGVAAVKAAMDLAGFAGGAPRLPLLPMDQKDLDVMKDTLTKEGLI